MLALCANIDLVGASLFDLNDPTIKLGRLQEPLLMPDEDERDGHVPNMVYSCGSIIHGDKLFIPYAPNRFQLCSGNRTGCGK
jgi:predicted GH43/DUF377 family glycosyl hydrolase